MANNRVYGVGTDSGIEDMDWTCECKYCRAKENALSHNYIREHSGSTFAYHRHGLIDVDPLKFEIEENCLCEDCMEIKYVRQYGFCSDIKMESTMTCVCSICRNIRNDYYLNYSDNMKPEAGCLCKTCRSIRRQKD